MHHYLSIPVPVTCLCRGAGLFIGIEIVTDRHNLPTPDPKAAKELVKRLNYRK